MMPTLDEFIQKGLAGKEWSPRNAWVKEEGFENLYVRLSRRSLNGETVFPVLDLANMTVAKPGEGVFTRLVHRLRNNYPNLHLLVEHTHDRFGRYLMKLQFIKLNPAIYGESYLLLATTADA